jgi:hypothetical protein
VICLRMSRLEKAPIDAAPEMLDEGPEQPAVSDADRYVTVENDVYRAHDGSPNAECRRLTTPIVTTTLDLSERQ